MYKYYKELENPEDFKIYLTKEDFAIKRDKRVQKEMSLDFIKENQYLLRKLEWLEKLIAAHNEKFGYPLFMDSYKHGTLTELYFYKEDLASEREECGLEEIRFITNSGELRRKLEEYEVYCNYFIELYPERKKFFLELKQTIEKAYKDIIGFIKIPPAKKIKEVFVPNGWYITKSGYLYNPFGKVGDQTKGHKEGNLRYSFDRIKSAIKLNRKIEEPYYNRNTSYQEHVRKIIKEGCATELDFRTYSNIVKYNFNTILTETILQEMNRYTQVRDLPEEELKELILPNKKKWIPVKNKEREELLKWVQKPSDLKVSYQPNINTLVKGYYAAVIDLYSAFRKLNASNKKIEMYNKIWKLCTHDYNDVLIRFCGFSKVERCEKKITTASPFGIENFSEYLKKGWDLYIVPEIVYSDTLDDIRPTSYIVNRYLEDKLDDYEKTRDGEGRVLIRGINC